MGFHFDKMPQRVVLEVEKLDDAKRTLFKDFAKLCVLREVRREDAYAELIAGEVAAAREELERDWKDWNGLEKAMKAAGFTINRTTFWSYRNKGMFDGMVKSDGVTTLFDAASILAKFRENGEAGSDLTKRTG